jgi:hypothetical protein
MIPGFNVLVTRGLIAPDDAIISYGMTTVALILLVSVTAIRWQRTSKQ